MVSIFLQNWSWDNREHLLNARYIHAVQAAAVADHKDIVLALLDHGNPFTKASYDEVIVRTAKTSKVSMMELLLSRRQQHLDSNIERAFWEALIRSASECNNQELLLHIMPEGLSKVEESSIGLAVEDGCRKGHYEIFQMLSSALPGF